MGTSVVLAGTISAAGSFAVAARLGDWWGWSLLVAFNAVQLIVLFRQEIDAAAARWWKRVRREAA